MDQFFRPVPGPLNQECRRALWLLSHDFCWRFVLPQSERRGNFQLAPIAGPFLKCDLANYLGLNPLYSRVAFRSWFKRTVISEIRDEPFQNFFEHFVRESCAGMPDVRSNLLPPVTHVARHKASQRTNPKVNSLTEAGAVSPAAIPNPLRSLVQCGAGRSPEILQSTKRSLRQSWLSASRGLHHTCDAFSKCAAIGERCSPSDV